MIELYGYAGRMLSLRSEPQARRSGDVRQFGIVCVVLGYTQVPISDRLMLVLGFPLGFFASGIFSGMGAVLTELFPTELRGSGQGFCYDFGRGAAALFPALVSPASTRLGVAVGASAGGAFALVVGSALMLPETTGQEPRSLAEQPQRAVKEAVL